MRGIAASRADRVFRSARFRVLICFGEGAICILASSEIACWSQTDSMNARRAGVYRSIVTVAITLRLIILLNGLDGTCPLALDCRILEMSSRVRSAVGGIGLTNTPYRDGFSNAGQSTLKKNKEVQL